MVSAAQHLHVGFNQDNGCFAVGESAGFRIFNTHPFNEQVCHGASEMFKSIANDDALTCSSGVQRTRPMVGAWEKALKSAFFCSFGGSLIHQTRASASLRCCFDATYSPWSEAVQTHAFLATRCVLLPAKHRPAQMPGALQHVQHVPVSARCNLLYAAQSPVYPVCTCIGTRAHVEELSDGSSICKCTHIASRLHISTY